MWKTRLRQFCTKKALLSLLCIYITLTLALWIMFSKVEVLKNQFQTFHDPDTICDIYDNNFEGPNLWNISIWGNSKFNYEKTTIPRLIHQTYKTSNLTPKMKVASESFQQLNPNWKYFFYNDSSCFDFVKKKFPSIFPLFSRLPGIFQADLFRYLVIYDKGGVYSDIDTTCLRPISLWTGSCEKKKKKPISVILAIECERGGCNREVQFVQWTFAFAPKHLLMKFIIEKVISRILKINNFNGQDAAEITGPGTFTDAIFEFIEKHYRIKNVQQKYFPSQTKMMLGDILILNKFGFNGGNVRHGFAGSWRPLPMNANWLEYDEDPKMKKKKIKKSLNKTIN